jgi:MFS transporter, DHA2 family, methylenomycin A resistance protein
MVDGYTLMFAALLLSAGALSDRLGARRAFGTGITLFVIASAACGLAPSLGALVVARFIQGAAAAVMMPSSMAPIGQAYVDPVARARAVAVWAVGGAVASSSGPVLGGLLTLVTWRMIFSINIPVGAAALILLVRTQPSPPFHRARLTTRGDHMADRSLTRRSALAGRGRCRRCLSPSRDSR